MHTRIFITGMGTCREAPAHIETSKAVKTVIKAEELALAALSAALRQIRNLELDAGIVFGIDNAIDRCKAEFFKGLLAEGTIGASPLLFPYTSHNVITAQATIAFGIKGEDITIASGASSFLKAVGYGFELLHRGVMNAVIAGGASENGAMVIIMESLTPDEAQKKKEEGVCLREVIGYNNTLLQACPCRLEAGDEAKIKTIEGSFSMVEDFLEGRNKLVTAEWIFQVIFCPRHMVTP
ncbi:MAG: beta-ketoacyl synthase N-terminal-like domain-containing protein [Deltaproteobacteria bacterium]